MIKMKLTLKSINAFRLFTYEDFDVLVNKSVQLVERAPPSW